MQKKLLPRTQSNKCYCCGSNTEYSKFPQSPTLCSKHQTSQKPQKTKDVTAQFQESTPAILKIEEPLEASSKPRASEGPTTTDKENAIMRDIIATNSKYFMDKTKVCCSVRPSNQKLRLPSTTGGSMYNKEFTPKGCSWSDKIQPFDAFRTSYPFLGQTNYNVNYVEHPLGQSQAKHKDSLRQEDGPRFLQTMYGNEYKNWGGKSATFKIEPQENNILGKGGVFNGKSVYNSEFVPKKSSVGYGMGTPTDNQMFLNMNIPLASSYRNEFTSKKAELDDSFKPKNSYAPEMGLKDAYNSEYHKMYDPKQHDHCHYRKVMSVQQLQDLITRKS